MASYLTSIDVLYPVIPATDLADLLDDDADGSADSTVFASLATMVETIFHGYVAGRYQVPLDTTDATLLAHAQMFCARLFEYHAFARRRAVSPQIESRYKQTIKELEGIRDGKVRFDDPPSDEASILGGLYNSTEDDRDYTASSLQYFGGAGNRE